MKIIKSTDENPMYPYKLKLPGTSKKLFVSINRGWFICEDLYISDIEKRKSLDFPKKLRAYFLDINRSMVDFFDLLCIERKNDELSIIFAFKVLDYLENIHPKWPLFTVLRAVKKETSFFNDISVLNYKESRDTTKIDLEIKITIPFLKNIKQCINHAKQQLKKLVCQSKIRLNNLLWNPIYEKKEIIFSSEVIIPLFLKMGFESINLNHGRNEYGKDITFAELDKFGFVKLYAIQVKSGNISGSNNSQINTIISQIDDAFKMPYVRMNLGSPQYISTLIIITSGFFTHNAKEKILYKTNQGLSGSVYFFDKNKIQELVCKYWNKTIKYNPTPLERNEL